MYYFIFIWQTVNFYLRFAHFKGFADHIFMIHAFISSSMYFHVYQTGFLKVLVSISYFHLLCTTKRYFFISFSLYFTVQQIFKFQVHHVRKSGISFFESDKISKRLQCDLKHISSRCSSILLTSFSQKTSKRRRHHGKQLKKCFANIFGSRMEKDLVI